MTDPLTRLIRELRIEDTIYLHTEYPDLPLSRIGDVLGLWEDTVSGILREHHAGQRAQADAVRLMELPPTRRRVLHVESGSGRLPERAHTDTPARRAA